MVYIIKNTVAKPWLIIGIAETLDGAKKWIEKKTHYRKRIQWKDTQTDFGEGVNGYIRDQLTVMIYPTRFVDRQEADAEDD